MKLNSYQQFLNAVDSWRYNCLHPKSDILSLRKEYETLEDMEFGLESSTFCLNYKGYRFEGLFNASDGKKLYVFLNGARGGGQRAKKIPRYLRWSYSRLICGDTLCIEDPLYFQYPELPLAWYYGSKDTSCIKVMLDIVKAVCRNRKISEKDVVFVGSSGGGTASIYAACFLQGSMSIAINPQIYIQKYPYARQFMEITGIDLRANDPLFRNDLTECVKMNLSKHLILFNIRSEYDCEVQMQPFCKELGIIPTYGLTAKDNVALWLFDCKGSPNPHNTMETKILFPMIDYIGQNFHEGVIEKSNMKKFVFFANECWHEDYEKKAIIYQMKQEIKGCTFGIRDVTIYPAKEKYSIGNCIIAGIDTVQQQEMKYAFYLYKDGEIIEKSGYGADALHGWIMKSPGNYWVKGYIENKKGNRISKCSKNFLVDNT